MNIFHSLRERVLSEKFCAVVSYGNKHTLKGRRSFMTTRITTVAVPAPRWKFRLFLSVLILTVAFGAKELYKYDQGPREAAIAVQQLNGDDAAYAKSHFFAAHDLPGLIAGAGVGLVVLTWLSAVPSTIRYFRAEKSSGS